MVDGIARIIGKRSKMCSKVLNVLKLLEGLLVTLVEAPHVECRMEAVLFLLFVWVGY